jgi:hypothetical protein
MDETRREEGRRMRHTAVIGPQMGLAKVCLQAPRRRAVYGSPGVFVFGEPSTRRLAVSLQEAERRRRLSLDQLDNRVLTLREWCEVNGFSWNTGRRLIEAGQGPVITQLSKRRIGITIANDRAWKEARARG